MELVPLKTSLGHVLHVVKYKGQSKKASFVISSATGVLQKYYHNFALHLQQEGYTVYTFDYYGIGDSGGNEKDLKENTVTLSDWSKIDQASVIEFAKKQTPDRKIYLVTHSIGGQLFGLNPNHHMVDKVLMVASQSGYWRYYKGIHYPKMWLFWHALIPSLTPLFGYFPSKKLGLFENIPKNVAYEWMRWGKHPCYMLGHLSNDAHFFDKIKIPIKILTFPRDIYAPVAAAKWLGLQFQNAQVTHQHIIPEIENLPEIGHFGFFRTKFKDSLWKGTIDWFESN
ncbi:alpha/beta fold hydrolase [Ascidiimonas sp. W6]|uniref:alpha/beta hydrolase family protein n=1 Tax=Ascidiimonas meishanensis TaxID=3128903 RepID=UPI0030EC0CA2